MTKLILFKDKTSSSPYSAKRAEPASEEEEILHLKRLLVTLKQQYESKLHLLNGQLQTEIGQQQIFQSQLEKERLDWQDFRNQQDEELEALKQQQVVLKDLVKKIQEELRQAKEHTAEVGLVPKEAEEFQQQLQNLKKENAQLQLLLDEKIQSWIEIEQEKKVLQEKYENLQEEAYQSAQRLEEVLEIRLQTENKTFQQQTLIKEQEAKVNEQNIQLIDLMQERDILRTEYEQLQHLLEESEMRLKTAQQHLAKKVKEVTLLNENLEEQQTVLSKYQHDLEMAYERIDQLQTHIDTYQKQENRMQEQLHEALKATENQVSKWEEKYFRMYEKWQESEGRVRELKKIEEKHYQMQNFLTNLGTFMGPPSNLPHLEILKEERQAEDISAEAYDLFEVKQIKEKFKTNLFS